MKLNGGFIGKNITENTGIFTSNAHFLKTKAGTFPNNKIGWSLENGPLNLTNPGLIRLENSILNDGYISNDGNWLFQLVDGSDSVFKYRFGIPFSFNTLHQDYEQSFSVTNENTSPRSIYFKSDGTKMYMGGISGVDNVYEYDLDVAYDLTSATFYQSLNVDSVTTNDLHCLRFSADGSKMYILDDSADTIFQWNLSTTWDISTAVYYNSLNVNPGDSAPQSFYIKPDGTKIYLMGGGADRLVSYTLSTPWDITTGSLDSYSLDMTDYDNAPGWVYFNSDGTKLYTEAISNLLQWNLSTAWDISTASPDISENVMFLSWREANVGSIQLKPDGTKIYIAGKTGDDVNEYNLSTPFDLSTATYVQNFSFSSQDTAVSGIFFKSDGTKLYMCGTSSDTFSMYDLSTAWDVSTASVSIAQRGPLENGAGLQPEGLFYKPDGTVLYYVSSSTDTVYQHNLSTAWDLPAGGNADASFSISANQNVPYNLFFKSDGSIMYITGNSGDDIDVYNLSTAWDISTASHDYAIELPYINYYEGESVPTSICFSSDGLKLFISGTDEDKVVKYSLSTAWDLKTANFPDHSDFFAVENFVDTDSGRSICFSNSGTKMYIYLHGSSYDILGYTLSTPWMVNTATYDGKVSVNEYESGGTGIDISSDGTKLYITGTSGDGIDIFTMTTPFDITTASWSSFWNSVTYGPRLGNPVDIQFKYDGTKMFFATSSVLYEYGLSTPWDPFSSTLVDIDGIDATSESGNYNDIKFSYDGSKMYVIGDGVIAQYNLSDPWDIYTASHYHTFTSSSVTDISFSGNGNQLLEMTGGNTVHHRLLTTPWDISTLQAQQNPKTVSAGGVSLQAASSGNAFYIMTGNTMQKYSMSTAWDPSSAGNATSNVFGSSAPQGIYGSSDYLFVVDNNGTADRLYKLPLYTNSDLTSFNTSQDPIAQNYINLNTLSPTAADPRGVYFKSDGTRMYIADRSSGYIRQYDLSTAWDTTIIQSKNRLAMSNCESIFIDRRGENIHIVSLGKIRELSLDTKWSSMVSSSTYNPKDIKFDYKIKSGKNIAWDTNGKYLYILNEKRPMVVQYQMR